MGSTPSIFEKTPQEHAEAATRDLEKRRETAIWPPQLTLVRPGHARVEFYAYRYRVRDRLRPDIEAVLPLEKSGELSLFTVRRIWGLETSSIIDPLDLKLGFPADLNLLPACVVTEQLAKHGCIKLIEPYTSCETLIKRQLRHIAVAGMSALHCWFVLALAGARNDYCRLGKHLSEPIYVTKTHYIDWARTANLTVFLAILFLAFTSIGKDLVFRLGEAVVDTVAASTCLTLSLWACLIALFFVAPEAYAKALEMEDVKLMVVLSG
ncbi:hypothetical protein DFH08DRAFT_940772 [Mycena albidolilacea]|uniref:Uncharacterized protein n=1 Tax=Mycena albidolilacea TaxID=1033008 RepID=A0AAD6ZKL6_9AGAR|nr:hypothetical protein DFH08DRAFT_940772 [Mycena albidolilacea]